MLRTPIALGGYSILLVLCDTAPAAAQGKLQAKYEATLAGVSIGTATLNVDIQDDRYSVKINGGTDGVVKYLTSYSFNWLAVGQVMNGALVPTYAQTKTTAGDKTEEVRITFASGYVKEFSIVPEPQQTDQASIPVTDAYRRGVLDYVTSMSIHVPGTGDVVAPEACEQSIAVFDGRLRYDRRRFFKRVETVEIGKGYRGSVVVCAGQTVPVAGFTPEQIKEVSAQRSNEIAFAPVAGTRILVPFWIKSTTPLGAIKIEATSFATERQPSRSPVVTETSRARR